VRRKVSFRESVPVPRSYNPLAPLAPAPPSRQQHPVPGSHRPSATAAADPSGGGGSVARARATMPHHRPLPIPPTLLREEKATGLARPASRTSTRKERRQRERAAKEERWARRRAEKQARRDGEDRARGVGLALVCPACRVAVRTVPVWREGSCCLYVHPRSPSNVFRLSEHSAILTAAACTRHASSSAPARCACRACCSPARRATPATCAAHARTAPRR
jgi:hypothetical protein